MNERDKKHRKAIDFAMRAERCDPAEVAMFLHARLVPATVIAQYTMDAVDVRVSLGGQIVATRRLSGDPVPRRHALSESIEDFDREHDTLGGEGR